MKYQVLNDAGFCIAQFYFESDAHNFCKSLGKYGDYRVALI